MKNTSAGLNPSPAPGSRRSEAKLGEGPLGEVAVIPRRSVEGVDVEEGALKAPAAEAGPARVSTRAWRYCARPALIPASASFPALMYGDSPRGSRSARKARGSPNAVGRLWRFAVEAHCGCQALPNGNWKL
ncbi:hypothetical protein TTX_0345 [Thermoproteus tenax Kra 1]|uniref:Uncharacterized protein n=1 Tax=Thermoproteus tenax (strain ATCC 35583 / DSM 2078 / JCM 9277 / NBRC 100435 / Kra 1) TaxID=768679 RepID=G4RN76_THETK|nr:hypothetical protein TTX_0345 [Thermoproteus tenax Kra 1]